MNIGIIGGGAAGMMAAITASQGGADVTIIEHMPRIGKKILLTGSGKCNISNDDMDLCHFHSSNDNNNLVNSVFSAVSPESMLEQLVEMGLMMKNKNGYLYPYSDQASSVLDVLRFCLRDRNIEVFIETEVKRIVPKNGGFVLERTSDFPNLFFDKIIICTGSAAYRNTGSDGSGYKLCKNLGHNIIKPLSALTYLNCKETFFSSIAGIRTIARVEVCGKSETGELQITKTGISGIPVFNLSYLASKALDAGEKVYASVDFMPGESVEDFEQIMNNRIKAFSSRPLEELFIGIFHKNLGNCIIKESGIRHKLTDLCSSLSEEEIRSICLKVKKFVVSVEECGSFDNSQVLCGGVDTLEVSDTLESKIHNGLYFAGEVLDINGDCGGYNLTWAFCSGIAAARFALVENDKNS